MKPEPSILLSRLACRHLYPSGRHCRFPVLPNAHFCIRHIRPHAEANARVDLTPDFGPHPLDFKSAMDVNEFLCSLARLIIEDRISARRAAVLAYIACLELRTLRAIDIEASPDQGEFSRIVFDAPQPIDESSSEPASQDTSPAVITVPSSS
jgi:hypothetical protein